MDLSFTEEQEMLRTSVRDFLVKECPKSLVRKLENTEEGYSPELWREMAGLGWLGMVLPREYGGMDGSFLDLVIVLEQMGYSILPGPFFSTVVLGGLLILASGDEEQKREFLPKIATGEAIFTLALLESSAKYEAASIKTKAVPDTERAEYTINGTKLFVPDAHIADYLLCVAKTKEERINPEEGITIFLIPAKSPGIKYTLLHTLGRDKQCEVIFENVQVSKRNILGEVDQGWGALKRGLQQAAVAKCAEMVGEAQAVLDMSVEYAKERRQFGRPIGSFQAIQHHCANMVMDVDGARFMTYKLAWEISEGVATIIEVAMTKAWVNEACRRVTTLGQRIFGGVGFTEDHDAHLYYRRTRAAEYAYGDSDSQRAIVAHELGLPR